MNTKEYDTYFEDKFGLKVPNPVFERVVPLDQDTALSEREGELLNQFKTKGVIQLNLTRAQDVKFTIALGAGSIVELVHPRRRENGSPTRLFATVTPDSDYSSGKLSLAFIGRIPQNGQIWVPDYLDPTKPELLRDDDLRMYLSAANQTAAIAEHGQNPLQSVDFRHVLGALNEKNVNSYGHRIVQTADKDVVPHITDSLEKNRLMMASFSAQNETDPRNDLIWAPFGRLEPIHKDTGAPYGILITKNLIDEEAVMHGKVRTKVADKADATADMARMGFVTVRNKGGLDELARTVTQRLEGKW